ncbi:unnamed protein product [Medioppia subpectinata]|uniref:Serpin domain-containing protein n=1 Tax=Medioppia subpectinata TaxID=1979941 RepID=A0A7R9KLM1_9ACAR|nr:unnamed protein product [Medioppia subpectinata]CAG2105856.1 unnamed protein product [Medioppia subpectinata]
MKTFPTDGNNFYSPLSITTAILMVLNGANGQTERELRQLCNIGDNENLQQLNDELKNTLTSIAGSDNKDVVMKLANLLVVKDSPNFSLLKDYKTIMTESFESSVESVDFTTDKQKTINKINDWVSKQTNNKIKDLFKEELSDDTAMVLVNAIYFKGIWQYLFNKKDTKKGAFHDKGADEAIEVDMMSIKRKFPVKFVRQLDAYMFEMPFIGDMSMFILLPNEVNGLDLMTKKITYKTFNETIFSIVNRKGPLNTLLFPKFKLETEYDLKESLSALGVNTMFGNLADFSRINGNNDLKVSKAIHKAYIEVTEEGAEAAAVSKWVLVTRTFRRDVIAVDRPFMFAIVNKSSRLIWFLGQIPFILKVWKYSFNRNSQESEDQLEPINANSSAINSHNNETGRRSPPRNTTDLSNIIAIVSMQVLQSVIKNLISHKSETMQPNDTKIPLIDSHLNPNVFNNNINSNLSSLNNSNIKSNSNKKSTNAIKGDIHSKNSLKPIGKDMKNVHDKIADKLHNKQTTTESMRLLSNGSVINFNIYSINGSLLNLTRVDVTNLTSNSTPVKVDNKTHEKNERKFMSFETLISGNKSEELYEWYSYTLIGLFTITSLLLLTLIYMKCMRNTVTHGTEFDGYVEGSGVGPKHEVKGLLKQSEDDFETDSLKLSLPKNRKHTKVIDKA